VARTANVIAFSADAGWASVNLRTAWFSAEHAFIFHGSSSNIHVQSDVPGAEIYLDDEKIGTRDAVVEVSKKSSPIITVKKEGCDDAKAVVEKRFDAITPIGLAIDFGLISVLVVDVIATAP